MIALRVDLLLDVERRRVDDEVRPVLLVLAAPDELRIADLDLALLLQLARSARASADARAVPDDLRVEVLVARSRVSPCAKRPRAAEHAIGARGSISSCRSAADWYSAVGMFFRFDDVAWLIDLDALHLPGFADFLTAAAACRRRLGLLFFLAITPCPRDVFQCLPRSDPPRPSASRQRASQFDLSCMSTSAASQEQEVRFSSFDRPPLKL